MTNASWTAASDQYGFLSSGYWHCELWFVGVNMPIPNVGFGVLEPIDFFRCLVTSEP